MNPNLTTLAKAQGLMPYTGQPSMGASMVLTLLFWRIASDLWQRESSALLVQGKTHDDMLAVMAEQQRVIMHSDCLFDTCRSGDPAQTGRAIQAALLRLAALQPAGALNDVLRPERFIFLAGFLLQNQNSQALADIVALINMIDFAEARPSLACGSQFLAAITSLCPQHNRPVRDAAILMARLLQPQPGETVLDPACGHGDLLMACAQELARNFPDAQPCLHGMEAAQNHWSMAKMLMLLSGVSNVRLVNGSALAQSLRAQEYQGLSPADIVLTVIPDTAQPWRHALALREHDHRFPVCPPADSRVALVWHALASLNKSDGRMAVLISHSALATSDGDVLRRYLVHQNLLDAVIDLPTPNRADANRLPLLLIIRHQKAHTSIAFIGAHRREGPIPIMDEADMANHFVNAYEAYRLQQGHDGLLPVENEIVVNYHCLLDVQRYGAKGTRMNAA